MRKSVVLLAIAVLGIGSLVACARSVERNMMYMTPEQICAEVPCN